MVLPIAVALPLGLAVGFAPGTATARCLVPRMSTLYDVPVSNHGARVRFLIYKLGLEDEVKVVSPMELGGLRSEEYLALNPQGKMPLLVENDGSAVWESDAICRHLLEKYSNPPSGQSLWPADLAARTTSELFALSSRPSLISSASCPSPYREGWAR